MRKEELIGNAMTAMKNAYAPYSGFMVGAALLAESGKVYYGCNVENASYGVTTCAERSAFCTGVAQGEKVFRAIAIVGGQGGRVEKYCTPCGICRQVMSEFCTDDFEIYLYNGVEIKEYKLAEIMPMNFSLD